MLKILIAVDGSEHANRAIETAAKMAQSTVSLEACLISVRTGAILEPLFANDYSMITLKKLDSEQEDRQTTVLNNAAQYAKDHGLTLGEPVRAHGNVAQEIVRIAKERQADLIVMGTRGLSALSGILLGSVAQKVLHDSSIPVVMVK